MNTNIFILPPLFGKVNVTFANQDIRKSLQIRISTLNKHSSFWMVKSMRIQELSFNILLSLTLQAVTTRRS